MKHFVTLSGSSKGEIESLLDRADTYADALLAGESHHPVLARRVVANAFFEPSTRTRLSFERAAHALGATVLDLQPDVSSTVKGESLRDTVLTVSAIGAEILILRHSEGDAAVSAAEWTGLPVINAGTGVTEHPTQTLLDLLTLRRRFGDLDGLQVGIVGDVADSRVATGLRVVLPIFGAKVTLVAPPAFLPREVKELELDDVLPDLDVVYLLRIQHERGAKTPPDFVDRFQMNQTRSRMLKDTAVIMHPGPMNRGIELTSEIADGPRSLILEQVRNGVPARMAVLDQIGRAL